MRDTRNLAFGLLPFAESPGGDGGGKAGGLAPRPRHGAQALQDRSVLQPGDRGRRRRHWPRVTMQLPDNLTNFKIRAKAASGPDRFGFATGQIAVRLPVIVQPALAALRAPGRPLHGRRDRAHRRGGRRPRHGAGARRGRPDPGRDDARDRVGPRTAPERIEFEVDVPTRPTRRGQARLRGRDVPDGRRAHLRQSRRRLRGEAPDPRRPRAGRSAQARRAQRRHAL